MIDRTPLYIDLDRRRELVFDINTEILIGNAGASASSLWETIGERTNAKTGATERILNVNRENVRTYLWAALQSDARKSGEKLTVEDVGALITSKQRLLVAVTQISKAIMAYYGDTPGEA